MTSMNPFKTLYSICRAAAVAGLAASVATLAGCGGGSTQLASGGIVGTGDARLLSSGIVTAAGPASIVVAGQTVSIAAATITVNGAALSPRTCRILDMQTGTPSACVLKVIKAFITTK